MPKRDPLPVTDAIYHVFNRGVEKRDIFLNRRDYKHFLETLGHYYRGAAIKLSRKFKQTLKEPISNRAPLVEILAFCLMPNHFHLLLRQKEEGGISNFMRLVCDSFTRYFNIKNERLGPLFQGAFKAVLVESDEQLLHVSRYIHLNPLIANVAKDLNDYLWSSYPAYIGLEPKEWREIVPLDNQMILSQFSSNKNYEEFVRDQISYANSIEEIKHHRIDD